jgi:4-amino-4-deoxy-L-arabinose transferase-like glycosyltransferase
MTRAAARAESAHSFRRTGWAIIAAFGLAWLTVLLTSRYPGYVHHDTTEAFMWSQVGWPLGFAKHPPLLPWLLRAVSHLVPLDWVGLCVLSAINISVGALAVWRIARAAVGEERALLALCLYGLSPNVTALALKLNHNAILVSLWPLIVWAFLASLARRTAMSGLLFGVAAAAGALAKYYSLLLLAACFVASLVSAERDRYYRSAAPYVAVAAFAALVAPHIYWIATHELQPLQHALRATASLWQPALHFAVLVPLIASPMVLGLLLYLAWSRRREAPARPPAPIALRSELVALAFTPYLLTVLLTIVFRLQGSTSWALPVFGLVPVLLAGLAPAPDEAARHLLRRAALVLLGLIAVSGPIALAIGFRAGAEGTVEPRTEAAWDGAAIWRAALAGEPRIVGGNDRWANAASLALPSHPLGWTGSSPVHAPWVTPGALDRAGALFLCRDANDSCAGAAASLGRDRSILSCWKTYQRRLAWMTGPAFVAELLLIAPRGRPIDRAAGEAACRALGGNP